jgi:hypothetical protein
MLFHVYDASTTTKEINEDSLHHTNGTTLSCDFIIHFLLSVTSVKHDVDGPMVRFYNNSLGEFNRRSVTFPSVEVKKQLSRKSPTLIWIPMRPKKIRPTFHFSRRDTRPTIKMFICRLVAAKYMRYTHGNDTIF